MIVPPEYRQRFDEAMGVRNCIDFAIDCVGSTIIHKTSGERSIYGG